MKKVVALVRKHAPGAKVVLGGYGTVLPDAILAAHSDHVCREEGVGFMRRLLGEPAGRGPGTFRHPLVVSRLKVFSREASRTGMVFAGLGCPNGCDFCCTSQISVLASMIVGLPYQTPAVIDEELSGLLALRPTLAQFMICGPIPGTPFFEQVVREGRLAEEMKADPETFWKSSTGFRSMVKHPAMIGKEIETAQERCFDEDFRRLGPSIYRSLET